MVGGRRPFKPRYNEAPKHAAIAMAPTVIPATHNPDGPLLDFGLLGGCGVVVVDVVEDVVDVVVVVTAIPQK